MGWWGRLCERGLGYQPVGRWRLCRVDAAAYRRGLLPERVPLPRAEAVRFKRGAGSERLPIARLAEFARAFLNEHPRHPAAPELRRLVAKAPLAHRIEETLREHRWDAAEPLLRELLDVDPADARARFLLGVCRLQARDLDTAQSCFDQVAGPLDTDAEYHAAIGRLREAVGRPAEARASYRRALELQPGHDGVLERLHALGEMVEVFLGTLDSPERAFLPIAEYEALIVRTWDAEPRDARFFLDRSHQHLRTGQPGLARAAAERARARLAEAAGPPAEQTEALAARCRALIALELHAEASEALDDLEADAPDSAWAASCRGHLLWSRGERDEAAATIRRALALDSNRLEDLRLYLDPRFPGRPKDLHEALSQLLNVYPQSTSIQSLMACALIPGEDRPRGLELAAAATRLGASDECLIDITGTLGRLGLDPDVWRIAEAAGGWQRFLRGDAFLRSNLAVSFAKCGREDAARALWQSVMEDENVHPALRLRARDTLRPRGGDPGHETEAKDAGPSGAGKRDAASR